MSLFENLMVPADKFHAACIEMSDSIVSAVSRTKTEESVHSIALTRYQASELLSILRRAHDASSPEHNGTYPKYVQRAFTRMFPMWETKLIADIIEIVQKVVK